MEKEKFNVGDYIILKTGKVGKIEEIFEEGGVQMFRFNEYYTPERTSSGKQEYHSDFELFRTDEIEKGSLENISSKCEVLKFDQYIKKLLSLKEKKLNFSRNNSTFFVRQKYSVGEDHFAPDLMNSCYCDRPFNPDKNFIQCKKCKELIHLECFLLEECKKCFNQSCDNNIEAQTTLIAHTKESEQKNPQLIGNKREREIQEELVAEKTSQSEKITFINLNLPNQPNASYNAYIKKQKISEEDKINEIYPNLPEESKKYLLNLIQKNEKKSLAANSHVSSDEKSRITIREKIFNSLVINNLT